MISDRFDRLQTVLTLDVFNVDRDYRTIWRVSVSVTIGGKDKQNNISYRAAKCKLSIVLGRRPASPLMRRVIRPINYPLTSIQFMTDKSHIQAGWLKIHNSICAAEPWTSSHSRSGQEDEAVQCAWSLQKFVTTIVGCVCAVTKMCATSCLNWSLNYRCPTQHGNCK